MGNLIFWINFLRSPPPTIVFDVGANKGNWSNIAKSKIKSSELHLFEPSGVAYKLLTERYHDDDNIVISNVACSDKNEILPLYYDNPGSSLASLTKRDLSFYNIEFEKAEDVQCIRLDDYIKKNNIAHINLLKMDVEGHELSVLRGLGDYLNPNFVEFIQFEYGGCNIDSNTTLKNHFEIFTKAGFRVGKLYPKEVIFNDYVPRMENFQYSNWVAVANHVEFK